MKKAYDIRNRIVHAHTPKRDEELLIYKAQEIMRFALRYLILKHSTIRRADFSKWLL